MEKGEPFLRETPVHESVKHPGCSIKHVNASKIRFDFSDSVVQDVELSRFEIVVGEQSNAQRMEPVHRLEFAFQFPLSAS